MRERERERRKEILHDATKMRNIVPILHRSQKIPSKSLKKEKLFKNIHCMLFAFKYIHSRSYFFRKHDRNMEEGKQNFPFGIGRDPIPLPIKSIIPQGTQSGEAEGRKFDRGKRIIILSPSPSRVGEGKFGGKFGRSETLCRVRELGPKRLGSQ